MTLINPIEKLEIINEYYAGLRNALHIDSLLLNQWNLKNDKLDLAEIEKKIFETPSDENLKKTMQGPYSSLLLYIFLRLPLLQADIYEKQNCLLLFEPDFAPPSYCLDDTDEMIEALSRMSRLGREQIINYYTKASFQEIVLLKKAIFDLDKNSLKQLLDTKNVDLTWIQKLLGLFCYMEKTKDGIVHGNMSKNEYLSIIQPSILELLDGDIDDRYQSEFLDKMFQLNSIINKDDIDADKFVNTLFEQSNACLKLYWSEQEIYKEQSRTIIDDYINKPCFEEFVSKCRAEFEEDERRRKNADSETNDDSDNNLEVVNNSERQPQSFEVEDDYKPFTFSPTDKPTNLYPESEYAFDGSVGLASFAINNKEKFERFIALTVNTFHYLHGKNQAKAFVRTITGIKCDGGVIKPKLQSDDAVYAVLYMAQRGILTGKINQALQKFDFEYGVKNDGKGSWHATYAKKTNNQFKRLVFETFCDYEGFKNDKNIDF